MAEQTQVDRAQVDRADVPTENTTATSTGEMPSPRLSREREEATKRRSMVRWIALGAVIALAVAGFFVWRYLNTYEATDDAQGPLGRDKPKLADAEATAKAMNLNVPVETISTTTQVSSSEANVQASEAGVGAAKQQLDSARAQLQQAEANNALAEAEGAPY